MICIKFFLLAALAFGVAMASASLRVPQAVLHSKTGHNVGRECALARDECGNWVARLFSSSSRCCDSDHSCTSRYVYVGYSKLSKNFCIKDGTPEEIDDEYY